MTTYHRMQIVSKCLYLLCAWLFFMDKPYGSEYNVWL